MHFGECNYYIFTAYYPAIKYLNDNLYIEVEEMH